MCGVGGVHVSELFAGQSDEGGQDEIGQNVFRALPHVPLLRWRGIVDLRLRDAVRITFSSVLLLHFGDGLGSERFRQGGGRRRAGLFLWKEDQDRGRGEASRVRDETFFPRGLCAVERCQDCLRFREVVDRTSATFGAKRYLGPVGVLPLRGRG